MLDVPQSLMENKSFAAFFEALRQVNFTKEETLQYFKNMTDEMCWQAALKYQKQEGLKEGRQDERIKMAKACKEQGISVEVIAKASGLSVEEIEEL